MQCSTVQIQLEPSEGNPTGVVVINQEDYDAETMTLVGDKEPTEEELAAQAAKNAEAAAEQAAKELAAAAASAGSVSPPWANK